MLRIVDYLKGTVVDEKLYAQILGEFKKEAVKSSLTGTCTLKDVDRFNSGLARLLKSLDDVSKGSSLKVHEKVHVLAISDRDDAEGLKHTLQGLLEEFGEDVRTPLGHPVREVYEEVTKDLLQDNIDKTRELYFMQEYAEGVLIPICLEDLDVILKAEMIVHEEVLEENYSKAYFMAHLLSSYFVEEGVKKGMEEMLEIIDEEMGDV